MRTSGGDVRREKHGAPDMQDPPPYNVNSRSEENFIRNTSLFGPRLEYVFRNTCGIRPEYCEYGQNTAPWEVFWNTWNTYSHSRLPTRSLSQGSLHCNTGSSRLYFVLYVLLFILYYIMYFHGPAGSRGAGNPHVTRYKMQGAIIHH